eukprot:CAMPEP_0201191482 /NCGR_PEP_ID=MMETSP0851-20130426/142474_1 /ASSEMBLY_ACC=CAM_ASM_000631 /TAXON_ID=183588 /ORGANISM="Pseudo-nitzschia fraudulenta, Strain WWA7" /LENGTH=539 /DNA_ID=CAMNT_0047477625 /DNA_START=454 /DNA_END=2073 /DNA_ORIENTATION=+
MSSAFPLKGLTTRRPQCSANTLKTTTIWKGHRDPKYHLLLGMNQDRDGTFENPDDQGENEPNKGEEDSRNGSNGDFEELRKDYKKRITRLEDIVSRQEVELHRLKNTCAELSEVSQAFGQLLQLLREAGLDAESLDSDTIDSEDEPEIKREDYSSSTGNKLEASLGKVIESYDDALIFGTAPTSVIDAADGAGAAILAAMLGGKQRMLVDVRDAELSSDPEILVQFIELAILPIAAGLEGLKSTRNRVKIVFPKVSQLLEYRRTMALAAPEVVALSTLGFDPVEKRDKLVVIVAPEPDDEEGIQAIIDLLTPSEEGIQPIQQPVVILNYHMLPFSGVNVEFETAYHLRLLAVQYMADLNAEELIEKSKEDETCIESEQVETDEDCDGQSFEVENSKADNSEEDDTDDEALENAMKHAHEVGVNEGVTRAMVIRAYPRPWHIFVDMSPNTNADFEVAATFDKEPSMDELNLAIVECLEGSEREDEIVAQQMQQALEDGQLNKVSDLLSDTLDKYLQDDEDDSALEDDEDDDFDMFEEDSV